MAYSRKSGFTLIELLVGMTIFMLIMFLTLAVWSKAQHATDRAVAIMNMHYNGRLAMETFDMGMRSTTPSAYMYLTHLPRQIRLGEGVNADNREYYNINAFYSAGFGRGWRNPEDQHDTSRDDIDSTQAWTVPYQYWNEKAGEMKWSSANAQWGRHITGSIIGGPNDANFVPQQPDGTPIPLNEDGSVPDGYDPTQDPRGWPFNTYPPSGSGIVEWKNLHGGYWEHKTVLNNLGPDARLIAGATFMMKWCNGWWWRGTRFEPWRGYNQSYDNFGARVTSETLLAAKEYRYYNNRPRTSNARVPLGMTIKPQRQSDTIDDLAFVYRALNGCPIHFRGNNTLIETDKTRRMGPAENQVEWSRNYGELVRDGEVDFITTAPAMEFAIRHSVMRHFYTTYEKEDNHGDDEVPVVHRFDRKLPDARGENWPTRGITGIGPVGDWNSLANHAGHPFWLHRNRGTLTSEQEANALYREIPATVGVEISTAAKDDAGNDFPDDGFFTNLVSPHGDVPMRQPRWVRMTFQLVDDSNIPIKAGDTRARQMFDHWVRIR